MHLYFFQKKPLSKILSVSQLIIKDVMKWMESIASGLSWKSQTLKVKLFLFPFQLEKN